MRGGNPNPMKGKRYARATCGFCGREVSINNNGTLRAHQNPDDSSYECMGAGFPLKAATDQEIDLIGGGVWAVHVCVVCGDVEKTTANPLVYGKAHNHRKPVIGREGKRWVATWYSYGKRQWRRIYRDTHEAVLRAAMNNKER